MSPPTVSLGQREPLATLAHQLDPNAVRQKKGFLVRCPCHDDMAPSLSLRLGDRDVLLHCFAGCHREQIIAELRRCGFWPILDREPPQPRWLESRNIASTIASIRSGTGPGLGTPVEAYLRSRSIDPQSSDALLYHPNLRHRPTRKSYPAMVALVSNRAGRCVALHRTYLQFGGLGKANVVPAKMALGAVRGCAIHLDPYVADKMLVLAEGIETALSVRQQMRRNGRDCCVWSALSAAGLRSLILPHDAKEILIAADNDAAGENAAQDAARRWIAERRRVSIARPPVPFNDFNDLLRARSDGGGADA